MKKIIASALGLVLVGGVAVTNAAAVESQFGGYWRTRMFFQDDFVQNAANDNDSSYNRSDNRTRLYYTAKFSDNFKFVNKFEFNSNWGDTDGGDLGADGNTFRVKNSYADFTLGMVNTKLGIQGGRISRGFIMDNDFSGAIVTADFGSVKIPVLYAAGPMDDVNNTVDTDTHILSVMPKIQVNDSLSLTPHVTFVNETEVDSYVYFIGADVDMKFDAVSAWGTLIYNGGEFDNGVGAPSSDVSAWLVAAGANAGLVHGQAFYATGDDDPADNDVDAFVNVPGTTSYYWSEIMGLGAFDSSASQGAPGDQVSNIAAFNVGVTVKPMDKLKFDFDVWYAFLAEDNAAGDDELGLEFDAKLTYALMDNLNAEFILAYLVAGDATGDEDVMEGGVRVSLSF